MVIDHGIIAQEATMETMAISEFKAKCLAVMKRVQKTRKPILITKRGEPVVEIVPAVDPAPTTRRLGCMRGTAVILGDIISPGLDPDEWEMNRD
jgi:prevent-host-death family protein